VVRGRLACLLLAFDRNSLFFLPSAEIFQDATHIQPSDVNDYVKNILTEGISVNSSAYIVKKETGNPEFIGAKTECALLILAERLGVDYVRVRQDAKIKKIYPFSSKKKRMSTIVNAENGYRYFCKGMCYYSSL
jgi:magnesium-transporting ATPase (P-type)